MVKAPAIGVLTDFGQRDGYVGVMKAVMIGIAPDVPHLDISHEVAPQDVEMGAWVLGVSWRYFPVGSVFLCVVDPGVGSARRAIALAAGGRYFVGPDNGLFTYPLKQTADAMCVELTERTYHLPEQSATFHGRDIFAPCAAHLASGISLDRLGVSVSPASLVSLPFAATPVWEDDALVGRIAHIDHYGNLITNIGSNLAQDALGDLSVRLTVGAAEVAVRATHFADGPSDAPFFLLDSSGYLAIAVRNASAAALLGAARGERVVARGFQRGVAIG